MRTCVWLALGLLVLAPACTPRPDPAAAADELRRIFELSSVDMEFRDVIYHKAEDALWGVGLPWSKKEVLFAVNFHVRAGFDLGAGYRLTPSPDRTVLEVEWPSPKILLVDADDQSIQEYQTDGLPLGYVRLQGLLAAREEPLRQEALRLGILEKAKFQARSFLEALFLNLGYTTVNVQFRNPEAAHDPS